MIVAGIDPGLKGAVAIYNGVRLHVFDMPTLTVKRQEVDAGLLARYLSDQPIDHAWIEQVGSMPGNSAHAMFAFGEGFGIVKGVLAALAVPLSSVRPAKWKNALAVPADKDAARGRASQLFPAFADKWPLKKHDGRAEAALIALYGLQQQSRSVEPEIW